VDTISKTNAWAVGDYTVKGTTKQAALTVHWNGTRWAWVPNPGETSGGILNGVSMVSATDGWAVGQGSTGALILHWNGTTCRGPNRYSRRRAPCLPQSAPVCLHIQCGRVTYAGVRSLPTNRARHDARAAR
jgi:hypothetical protein